MTTPPQSPGLPDLLFSWWRRVGRILPWREKIGDPLGQPAVVAGEAPAANPAQPSELTTLLPPMSTTTLLLRDHAFSHYFASHLRRDPYRVVLAELMLQQTQVERVLPKYEVWIARWSTTAALAAATLAEVLIAWQGLGYNRRARFLWLLAQEIARKRAGRWPETEAELLALPGIGRYTARAILSFAFGQQLAVVDTNIKRVLRRVLDGQEAGAAPVLSEKTWFARADAWLPAGQADPWNQALMDLGALICTARAPKCQDCPLAGRCQANLTAQAAGWADYRSYLAAQLAATSPSAAGRPRRPVVPFAKTDRFFRGRILDLLRQQPLCSRQLWQRLHQDYGLVDQDRFQRLLAALAHEQLISVDSEWVRLG